MKGIFSRIITVFAIFGMGLTIGNLAMAADYTITDLGTLGGSFSSATAINNLGQVVGNSATASGPWHAFMYTENTIIDMGTLGGTVSYATGINDNGQVVGYSGNSNVNGNLYAFLYSDNVMVNLGTLGGNTSAANAIDNAGNIVGQAEDSNHIYKAAMYRDGQWSPLSLQYLNMYSYGTSINSSGQVVGAAGSMNSAFLLSNGNFTNLGTLGGNISAAAHINDAGQVVGWSYTGNGEQHGFLYSNGTMNDLGTFGGNLSSANSINNKGEIVGSARTAAGTPHAYLYRVDVGTMIDLNTILPNGSGWELWIANDINEAGQIVGMGKIGGEMHAYILSPVELVANAGLDQSVNEGDQVILDGSGSSILNGSPLTYQWIQLAGPEVTLNLADPIHPGFTAPNVSVGGATLTFQLIVNAGSKYSAPDTVNITVKNVNHPPVANAGQDQTINEGSSVNLDGSISFDPDGDMLSFTWIQTAGTSVTLNLADPMHPTFKAPLVGQVGETLTFELTVSDGIYIAKDSIDITVENVNHAPTANAGMGQTVSEGTQVILNGTGSNDPDSDSLMYQWEQTGGTTVTLSDTHSAMPIFTAPLVGAGGGKLSFKLTVSDGHLISAPDTVEITVHHVNNPPLCNLARAVPAVMWPPNHKLFVVAISGVADPDNEQVTLTVNGVTQDEPVNGLGDGDTSPDAILQVNAVLLRAERSGTGNGRVYQIHFTADNDQGGRCTGAVSVSVPHSVNTTAVDDGQKYDSTKP